MWRHFLAVLSVTAAFVLPDGKSLFAGDADWLYWTTFSSGASSKVQRAHVDGSSVEDLITGLDAPWPIEIDPVGQKLYFGDVNLGVIQRAELDGTQLETILVGVEVDDPAGMAIDPLNNHLYWSDFVYDQIYRTDLTTNTTTVIISRGLTNPFGLALDLQAGKLYWADTGIGQPGKIQRSNLDGTRVEDIVTGLANPRDVAIGFVGRHVHWPDLDESAIYRASLDGTDAGLWLAEVAASHAVAIDQVRSRLYWTSSRDGISSIRLDGSGLQTRIVPPLDQYGIAVYIPEPTALALGAFFVSYLFLRRGRLTVHLAPESKLSWGRGKSGQVDCSCITFGVLIYLVVLGSAMAEAATIQSLASYLFDLTYTTGQQSVAHSQIVRSNSVSMATSFTPASLASVDIVYCHGGSDLQSTDISSLTGFVQAGGRLIVASDHGQFVGDNNVAVEFGVSYSAGRPTNLLGAYTATTLAATGSVLDGAGGHVDQFSVLSPNDSLQSTNPNVRILARYSTGQIALGQLSFGLGDVVFLTDLNTFDDDRLAQFDNQRLWTNLFDHVAVPEPATAAILGCGLCICIGALAALGRRRGVLRLALFLALRS